MASLTACVIPPSLSVGTEDAQENSPPAITAVRSAVEELAEPGPVVLDVGSQDMLSIDLLDTDITDTLYVRIFVDYNYPDIAAPRSTCKTGLTTTGSRTASCPQQGICLTADIDRTVPHPPLMTIVVFDREVKDGGTPAYMEMDPPGRSTHTTYILTCRAGT